MPFPFIDSSSEADDSNVIDVFFNTSLAGSAGILRQFVQSPNLANASTTRLLVDEAATLFFTTSFSCSRISSGFVCTTCLIIHFGLALFMSLWSAEGNVVIQCSSFHSFTDYVRHYLLL